MKTLFVLVGIQGAGKSTVLEALLNKGFTILKPSTTRTRRNSSDNEYYFETDQTWGNKSYAWEIQRSNAKYGMRISELESSDSCITVFDPKQLSVLHQAAEHIKHEIITIGLNTITSIGVQNQRVMRDSNRMIISQSDFDEQLKTVCSSDIVISGDSDTLFHAIKSVISIISSRGGVLNKEIISNFINANTLLLKTKSGKVQTASYDLHLADTYWCQGNFQTLDNLNNHKLVIPPYSYVLVQAQEEANLPRFISGSFDLKVSMFFNGLILSNGPQVDPGYKGALFCMLYNANDEPFTLKRGASFATIQFFITSTISEGYKGKYQNKVDFIDFINQKGLEPKGGKILERLDNLNENLAPKIARYQAFFWTIAAIIFGISFGLWSLLYSVYTTAESKVSAAEDNLKKFEIQLKKANNDLEKLQKKLDDKNERTK